MESRAMTSGDILGCLVEFVPNKHFLFFGPVSKSWKTAWGERPTTTSFVSPDSTASQLRNSLECGLPRNREAVCILLAKLGKLEPLKYTRERHCRWGRATCAAAAAGGRLAVLQWLVWSGCSFDERTCFSAAEGGHLAVLQWAKDRGCPLETAFDGAAAG